MKAARGICSAAGRLILGYGMVLASATMASAQTVPAVPPAGGAQEGITVHGRWVVEVQNPDGTVASRTEFNNALASGNQILTNLLSRAGYANRWELLLTAVGSQVSPCQGGTGGRFANWCRIVESAASNVTNGTAESRDLVVTTAVTSLSLTGTITALSDGIVGRVATSLGACTMSTPFASCNSAGSAVLFSDASLGVPGKPAPVPVVAGQIIKLTVTFTFS
jgi:hypothetical protein